MLKAPVIGITTHGLNEKGSYHIPGTYAHCVRCAGGIAVLLPPGETRLSDLVEVFDGFILTGGGDLDPSLYGGEKHHSVYGTDTSRDTMELELARIILAKKIPTLAICRGLQVFTVLLGGTLHSDILENPPADIHHRAPDFQPSMHPVIVQNPTRLSVILGSKNVECASIHHQAVDRLPKDAKVAARASDGIVEALEFEQYENLVAIQWHPEITASKDPAQQNLFTDLVNKSAQYKSNR